MLVPHIVCRRISFDIYRHRLAQQLAAAAAEAQATGRLPPPNTMAGAMMMHAGANHVIIAPGGNRILVVSRV